MGNTCIAQIRENQIFKYERVKDNKFSKKETYHEEDSMVNFAGAFYIKDKCNRNTESRCILGKCEYEIPLDLTNKEKNYMLAGL